MAAVCVKKQNEKKKEMELESVHSMRSPDHDEDMVAIRIQRSVEDFPPYSRDATRKIGVLYPRPRSERVTEATWMGHGFFHAIFFVNHGEEYGYRSSSVSA